ncbi:MAG: hypothetical protein GEV08_20980 [Acidimicrobiia bacterium]|nr:hypothetical protein [Acidimicrobiia bacterium]
MTTPKPPAPTPTGEADRDARPGDGLLEGDWPVRATDTIERLVDQARSKTTGPAIVASRWIVYGVVAAFLGLAALVLLIITAVRGLDVAIPGDVWIVYLVLGLVFALGGALLWRKRAPGTTG